MRPFKPVAIGGYKYASKVTDECTKWTAVYLLTNKNQALQSLQLLSARQSSPSVAESLVGMRQERRVQREEFCQYRLEAGIIQVFAVTNAPQQTNVSERVGRACSPLFSAFFRTAASHRSCGGSCSWRLRTSGTEHRTRRSRWRRHSTCLTAISRPLALLRHRSQNLRAHQGLQEARRRGLGREVVWL